MARGFVSLSLFSLVFITSCAFRSATPSKDILADELLISPQQILAFKDRKAVKSIQLTQEQVDAELALIKRTVEKVYIGYQVLNTEVFERLFAELSLIRAPLTLPQLRGKLEKAFALIPDGHLYVGSISANVPSSLPQEKASPDSVYHRSCTIKDWYCFAVKKVGDQTWLVLRFDEFPQAKSPRWASMLIELNQKIEEASGLILDFRENEGGYSVAAEIFAGFLRPRVLDTVNKRSYFMVNSDNYALLTNYYEYKKVENPSGEYDRMIAMMKEAMVAASGEEQSIRYYDTQVVKNEFGIVPNPRLFIAPIAVWVGKNCASACEYFSILLEDQFLTKRVGQQTAGVFHFGTGGALILPHSGLWLLLGTDFSALPHGRYVERVGLTPDVSVARNSPFRRYFQVTAKWIDDMDEGRSTEKLRLTGSR